MSITITIEVGEKGLEKALTSPLKGNRTKVDPPTPDPPRDADSEKGADFDLQLMARDSLEEDALLQLETEIALWIRELLQNKKSGCAREFLSKAKHHMTEDLKALIVEEIKAYKGK
jgi:hypothetical protein